MALTPMAFTPVTGLRDGSAYPTVPANEASARDQVQTGMDQLRDYLNNTVNSAIGAVNGIASLDATGKVPSSQLPTPTNTYNALTSPNAWVG